jgi:hypothetical protein
MSRRSATTHRVVAHPSEPEPHSFGQSADIGYRRMVGRSLGRHAARRSGLSRIVAVILGGAGLLVIAGILVSVAVPLASSGSAPQPTSSASAKVSIYSLKGFAKGPSKTVTVVPKTVLEPNVVADPYDTGAAPSAPTTCPDGTVAGSVDASGNQSDCQPATSPSG